MLLLCCTLLVGVRQAEQIVRVEIVGVATIIVPTTEEVIVATGFKVERLVEAHAAYISAKLHSVGSLHHGQAVGPLKGVSYLGQFPFKVVPDGKTTRDRNV